MPRQRRGLSTAVDPGAAPVTRRTIPSITTVDVPNLVFPDHLARVRCLLCAFASEDARIRPECTAFGSPFGTVSFSSATLPWHAPRRAVLDSLGCPEVDLVKWTSGRSSVASASLAEPASNPPNSLPAAHIFPSATAAMPTGWQADCALQHIGAPPETR